jgi:hypothetical protein
MFFYGVTYFCGGTTDAAFPTPTHSCISPLVLDTLGLVGFSLSIVSL